MSWAFDVTPDGVVRDHGGAEKGQTPTRRIEYCLIALLIVAAGWIINREANLFTLGTDEALPNSVAVLPFENLSADENNAYFAAGIHDTVLNELAKIADMTVIARTSVLRYADGQTPLRQIAEELHVETIMEGTVQYADGQVRITAQLVDPATGSHLWSRNYDRPFADIFVIQSEIASQIALALEAELLPSEQESLDRAPTRSEEAYALYLRARSLEPNMHPAMVLPFYSLLHEAVTEDPGFALAHATLAFAYARGLGYIARGPMGETLEEVEVLAISHAQRALNSDPNQGLAHAALAMIDAAHSRVGDARLHWDAAVEQAPNSIDVLDDAVHFYSLAAPSQMVDELANRVVQIDPIAAQRVLEFASWARTDFGSVTRVIRDRIADDQQWATRSESYFSLGFYEMLRGNAEVAIQELRFGEQLNSGVNRLMLTRLVYTYGRLGFADDAVRVFRRLETSSDDTGFATTTLVTSWVFGYLGVRDETLVASLLGQMVEDRGPSSGSFEDRVFIARNLMNDPILEKPDFVELREQLLQ